MDQSWVYSIPVKYIYILCSCMAAVLTAGLGYGANVMIKSIKGDRKKLADIGPKLDLIMTNHLAHIQAAVEAQGAKQDQTNIELAEQTGVLKTIADLLKK